MHKILEIIGISVLSIWAYCWIGLMATQQEWFEHKDMKGARAFAGMCMLLWPIYPFVKAFFEPED